MATFAFVHGGGDVGWCWHLVERALRGLGHQTVAPDLPSDNAAAGLVDYADAVVDAIGDRRNVIVVGHSYGGFTAPLVADRVGADALVLVAAMIPAPGETPAAWWENTGHSEAVAEQSRLDGGLTGSDDPYVVYYHDVPRALAEEAQSKQRDESEAAYNTPWPLEGWPTVRTRFIVCSDDRLFPARFMRRVVAERLGIVADEIAAGHYVPLSRPRELAQLLAGYVDPPVGARTNAPDPPWR
jgi:pimeloyl-ACP methyl ester carboxylesterase